MTSKKISREWKVYDQAGRMIAVCAHAEDAAALLALHGNGAKLRVGDWLVWHEGREEQSAAESYDYVREVAHARVGAKRNAAWLRAQRPAPLTVFRASKRAVDAVPAHLGNGPGFEYVGELFIRAFPDGTFGVREVDDEQHFSHLEGAERHLFTVGKRLGVLA